MMKNKQKRYWYVGDKVIQDLAINYPIGTQIRSQTGIFHWVERTQQKSNQFGYIEATFVIDLEGYLRLADRHSEHIACSGNQPVLSAGEISLILECDRYKILEISNQSTGFCPEPKSWICVKQALDKIPIPHPNRFTTEFDFRLCVNCGQINLVKENWFFCGVCNAKLAPDWNFVS